VDDCTAVHLREIVGHSTIFVSYLRLEFSLKLKMGPDVTHIFVITQ